MYPSFQKGFIPALQHGTNQRKGAMADTLRDFCGSSCIFFTLPETNVAPENRPPQ